MTGEATNQHRAIYAKAPVLPEIKQPRIAYHIIQSIHTLLWLSNVTLPYAPSCRVFVGAAWHVTCPHLINGSACPCRGPVKLPRYNKSAYNGAGDRAHPAAWPEVKPPVDVVLFEGWMLGFRPVGARAAATVHAGMPEVDTRLSAYGAAWDAHVDSWLVIEVADPQWVFKWRLQAEQQMRAAGKDGMSDEQVAEFVRRYMPAYEAYLPRMYREGPTTARPGRTLFVRVGETRELLGGRELLWCTPGRVAPWAIGAMVASCTALMLMFLSGKQKVKTR